MRARPLLLLIAFATFHSHARADTVRDRLRALVLRDAETRWTWCTASDSEVAPPQVLDLVVLGPGHALARVRTACHAEADGSANEVSTVVHVRRGRVSIAPFAPHPNWAFRSDYEESYEFLYNAALERRSDTLILSTGVFHRTFGDSGWEERYRWNGRRFVLLEQRARDGGDAFVNPGAFPIVAPEWRQCRATIEVLDGSRARLVSYRGRHRRVHDLMLLDAGCSGEADADTVACVGNPESDLIVYTVVTRDADWVVLRVQQAPSPGTRGREVLRIPRHCSLR